LREEEFNSKWGKRGALTPRHGDTKGEWHFNFRFSLREAAHWISDFGLKEKMFNRQGAKVAKRRGRRTWRAERSAWSGKKKVDRVYIFKWACRGLG
jgi:hypothetical protein